MKYMPIIQENTANLKARKYRKTFSLTFFFHLLFSKRAFSNSRKPHIIGDLISPQLTRICELISPGPSNISPQLTRICDIDVTDVTLM